MSALPAPCRWWSGRTASGPSANGVLADVPPGAQHMADDLPRWRGRHQGQRREPRRAGRSSSISLASGTVWPGGRRGERGGRDGADDVGVARGLASDQHAVTMARRRPAAQPDFAVIPLRRPLAPARACSRGEVAEFAAVDKVVAWAGKQGGAGNAA